MSQPSVAGVMRNCPARTIEEVSDGIIVAYTFNNPEIVESGYYPNTKYINYEGFGLNDNDGEPCIPFRNDIFRIPNNCNVAVNILDSMYTDTTFMLSPSIPLIVDDKSQVTKHKIAPYKGFFPSKSINSRGVFCNRGDAFITVSVTPVKYNCKTNTVRLYSYIKYKLTYSYLSPPNRGESYNSINKVCQNRSKRIANINNTTRNDKHYLIITTTGYKDMLEDFVRWKRLKGNNIHVASRTKGSWTVSSVQDSVLYYFNEYGINYVLIVGDHDDVPGQQFYTGEAYAITDFQYGLPVNKIAQIRRGRIPVNNTDELATVLNKIIKYEKTPIIDEDFYNTALHCARFEDGDTIHAPDGYEDRCYTLCVEELREYIKDNHDKNIIRAYACSPTVNPSNWNNGTYSYGDTIPQDLLRGNYNWIGYENNISDIIEDGTFYVLYRGHGWERSWSSPTFPPFPMSEVSLNNGNKLPFFFLITCLNGKYNFYNGKNCMAERLLKIQGGGGVGVIAATEKSYSGYNDALAYGIFDAIWPGFTPMYGLKNYGTYTTFTSPTYEVGEIMDLGLLRMSETWGNSLLQKRLYHCFGDPSMMLYTETPKNFVEPVVRINNDTLYVNVSEEECRINIVDNTTNDVQSYLGNSINQYVGGSDISVCIDKHNYVPYVWSRNVYLQNENLLSENREYHAQNVRVGKHVTEQRPQGNVNITNSRVFIKANNVLLDKGTYINVGSTFKIKTTN